MISNFHTHTFLCNHAVGTPDEYYAQAVKDGCSALGFSDHCPYPENTPDYWPNIRMSVQDASGYVSQVRALAASSAFPVYLGFECEWDSRLFNWYQDGLKGTFGADYLVLGSHWLTKGDVHEYIPDAKSNEALIRYTDQTIDGMRSGLFAFLAHPDLCMAHGRQWDADVAACMKAIIDAAKDLDMPLEVNGLGMHKPMCRTETGMRYAYPVDEFWQMAAQAGVRVICNADAHDPSDVIAYAHDSREYAKRFGIVPIETL
ncbi:MAG: histidinol-phosphatase [Treponema sp.]|nr:histidinol-phosphatase [Treponema sp.]